MTRDELINSVPIRYGPEGKVRYVALNDIPQPWRQEFWIALAGHAMAKGTEGSGPAAYADTWLRWVNGSPLRETGPSHLDGPPMPSIK